MHGHKGELGVRFMEDRFLDPTCDDQSCRHCENGFCKLDDCSYEPVGGYTVISF